jgi:hypothetical protein
MSESKNNILIFYCFVSIMVAASPLRAQCLADTDCKGGRICSDGSCIAPPSIEDPNKSQQIIIIKTECEKDIDCNGELICIQQQCVQDNRDKSVTNSNVQETYQESASSQGETTLCETGSDCGGVVPSVQPEQGTSQTENPTVTQQPSPPTSPQIGNATADTKEPLPVKQDTPVSKALPTASQERKSDTVNYDHKILYASMSFSLGAGVYGKTTIVENETYRTYEPLKKSIRDNILPGFYVALYGTPTPHFHLGLYLNLNTGHGNTYMVQELPETTKTSCRTTLLGTGISMKFGGRKVGKRLWGGFQIDLGYNRRIENTELGKIKLNGFQVSPRMSLNISLVSHKRLKVTLPITVGATVTPYGIVKNNSYIYTNWHIMPALDAGIAVGI